MNDHDLTAYCGLYCGDCIRFRSTAADLARELLAELEQTQFREYAAVKQSHIPDFRLYGTMVTLLTQIYGIRCDVPCRLGGDGCGGSCTIVSCVSGKSVEGCWECHRFETCEKLDLLKPFHGEAPVKNLRRIKELGVNGWTKHREACYPWQKRKVNDSPST